MPQLTTRLTRKRPPSSRAGFSLVEVLVALLIVSVFSAGAYATMIFAQRTALSTWYASEAHRLAQQKIEELQAGPFSSFAASSDETIVSSISPEFRRNVVARLVYPSTTAAQRTSFVRNVELVSSSGGVDPFVHLRVNVSWTFQQRSRSISLSTCRAQ